MQKDGKIIRSETRKVKSVEDTNVAVICKGRLMPKGGPKHHNTGPKEGASVNRNAVDLSR